MIENDDVTQPRPLTEQELETTVTTIQVPVPDIEPSSAPASTAQETVEATPTDASTPSDTAPASSPLPWVSVDDLLSLQIVSEPQFSPDGTQIAFTVHSSHAENNTTSSAIWLVNSQGGKAYPPRPVTTGTHHDFAPRWSPDGQTLAFLSDRQGVPQIYLLPLHGGEARQLTNLAQGISEYSWRPDGTMLLAHSAWKPTDDQPQTANETIALVYTRLDERWDGIGYKEKRHQQLWLIPLEGEPTRLTSEPVDLVQSCWSPDGLEIAFCANRRSDPDLSVSMALWILQLTTGQMRRLTPEEGLAQMPTWSPDGTRIAYYYTADQTEASNITPWLVNTQGEPEPQPATPQTQQFTCLELVIDETRADSLTRPQWFPDSTALLITVQERGQVHLYRIDLEQQQITQLTKGNGRYVQPQVSKNGQSLAMVRTDWFTPGDIWCMDATGEHLRKLTGVNDAFLRSHQLIRPKRITWQSFDGTEIEGYLYLPPVVEGTKVPLILEIHGGPTCAWGDGYTHEFQVLAGKGYAVLAANPRGSIGYGEDFSKKVLHDWGGDDFRDLMAGIDHVLATEPIDEKRLGIGGMSYGGYMTNWAITQTSRFKAAVSRNGISNLSSAGSTSDQTLWFDMAIYGKEQTPEELRKSRSPLTFIDTITTPLLLLHGESDLRCPPSESVQLFVALRKRKKMVELVLYPGQSHTFDWPQVGAPQQRLDRLRRTIAWFTHFV